MLSAKWQPFYLGLNVLIESKQTVDSNQLARKKHGHHENMSTQLPNGRVYLSWQGAKSFTELELVSLGDIYKRVVTHWHPGKMAVMLIITHSTHWPLVTPYGVTQLAQHWLLSPKPSPELMTAHWQLDPCKQTSIISQKNEPYSFKKMHLKMLRLNGLMQ